MSKQKTAVEWLYERLERMIPRTALYNIDKEDYFKHAQEMEREQIINTFKEAQVLVILDDTKRAEQFYYETYKSKGSDDHICTYEKCPQCLKNTSSQTEILDEEIIKLANEYILYNDSKRQWVIEGMKLYREQLKNK